MRVVKKPEPGRKYLGGFGGSVVAAAAAAARGSGGGGSGEGISSSSWLFVVGMVLVVALPSYAEW